MGKEIFGRTNRAFPSAWLSLAVPDDSYELPSLVQTCLSAETVIDISAHPGLFGGYMRGAEAPLMSIGGSDIGHSADEDSAANLIHAHLIETLCAVGREWLDFYFLRIRQPLEEFQINGALKALEWARDEGHVRFVGLSAETEPVVVVGAWQFHDAFEAVLLPNSSKAMSGLKSMAQDRRVGVITRRPLSDHEPDSTSLVTVRSKAEVNAVQERAVVTL